MYRDSGRKSLIPKTPLGINRRHDDGGAPRPSFSVQRQRMAEPRYSLAAGALGRMSTVGGARPSIAVGHLSGRASTLAVPTSSNRRCLQLPPHSNFKDPRPMNDRTRQAEMAQRVFEFLNSRDVPFPYTEKMIRLPNNKNEFKQLFEFLLREVDEDYQVGKIEEEVPKIFAALGFPVQIKNSTMVTIAAQHTWPTLLAALDWLITEVLQVSHNDESFIDEDMQLPYSYYTTCYVKKRVEQAPDYSAELEKFKQLMSDNENGRGVEESFRYHFNQRIDNEAQLKHLQSEIESEKTLISQAEARVRDFEFDIVAMKKYMRDFEVALSRKQDENKEQEIMLEKMAESLCKFNNEIKQKEALIGTQKMSGDEVRAIHNKSKKLKASLIVAREELKEAEASVDDLQPRVYKQATLIHAEYKKFLASLQDLCEKYLPRQQFDAINWMQYEYDKIWTEYSRDSKCDLTDLVSQLKDGMDCVMNRYREEKNQFERSVEIMNKEIRDLNTQMLEDDKEYKLKLEHAMRQANNIDEQIRRTEIERGLVMDKHNRAKLEYEKSRNRCMEASERLANVEKIYSSHRNDLERAFNDVLAAFTDKIGQLYGKIEQMNVEKENWLKLGTEVLEGGRKTLEDLRQKKRASVGANTANLSSANDRK